MKIKVYPTREASLVLRHPTDGALLVGGVNWEYDGHTCRLIVDGDITDDHAAAWSKAPDPAPKPAPAPSDED